MRRGVKQSTKSNGHIRVISGQWKGRKLPVLDLEGLRPTTDRTKETLFNWLAPYITQTTCLDAYAGAGSLGIESLSRQATHCTFYEKDKSAVRQLQSNMRLVKADSDSFTVIQGDTLQLLGNSSTV
jgi:16S rRNA (guanine966-N2)-methyltransferase